VAVVVAQLLVVRAASVAQQAHPVEILDKHQLILPAVLVE
jgi:hypothetical protein